MGIKRLPAAVVSSLRTDVTVTTAAQCVTELVLNSIDAGASSIAIRVDLKNYKIQVVDNGCGLSSSDLNLIGSRYMTSKCRSLEDLQSNLSHFGFRGEALCSISEVCGTMTIASRYRGSDETYCKVLTRGAAHNVSKSRLPRSACGTTVTVADFLFNRPVRRARIKPALDLEEIKSHIESIALINPTVSFSLRNDENGEVILQTQRTDDTVTTFGTLFGVNISHNLVPVKENMGPFKVEGYISNEAHPLKNLQFIYINKRLLLKTKIHKLVNSLLSRSAILKSNNVPYAPISKEINHSVFLAFSPPKRDKHAIFVLNITCPLSEYDITLDPKKTLVEFCNWDCLLSCFENLLRKFIEKEAGHSAAKDSCFDSEPPGKIKSVMDEINLLAREDAIGADVLQMSEESITTKNLPRAIHSLPANRCPVTLSPVPSTECFLSTSSSGIFSCTADGKQTIYSSLSDTGSVFTEKPYAPLPNGSTSQCKEKILPRKQPPGWTETECSETSQYSVEPLKSFFRRPQSSIGKKPLKGLLSEPIYFQENQEDLPYRLPEKNSEHLEEAAASPLNALASIKEIRRKKLLSNLNKFSFNVSCDKPVLLKTELTAPHAKDTAAQHVLEADNNLRKFNGTHRIACEKSPVNKLKESRAVQTSFAATIFDDTKDTGTCTSMIANESERCVAPSNICAENENSRNLSCVFPKTFWSNKEHVGNYDNILKCSDLGVLNALENEGNVNLHNAYLASDCSKIPEIEIKQFEGAHPNFLSVEDMIETGYSMAKNMPISSTLNGVLHSSCVEADQECVNTAVSESSKSSIFQMSESSLKFKSYFGDVSPGNKSIALGASSTIDSIEQSVDVDVFQYTDTNPGKKLPSRKIVDYDSSPCSSQETTSSVENIDQSHATCSSILKRKLEKRDEFLLKKLCSSPEDHITEMTSAPQNIDGTEETLELVPNEYVNRMNSKQEHFIDMSSICGTTPSNFDTLRSSKEPISTEQKNIHNFDEEMEEVECPESVPNQDPSKEGTPSSENFNEQQQWIEQLDHNGKLFYLHQKSGLTTYQMPKEEKQGPFKIGDRFAFLPKGMSPILYDKATNEPSNSPSITPFKMEEDLSAVKWSSDERNYAEKKDGFWPLVDQLLSAADEFSTKIHTESQVSSATVQELSQTDIKVYNSMFPYSFTRDLFNNLRVLGQLDSKFIVTVASIDTNKDIIVLFDQHAVHERIRVENLTKDYQEHDSKAKWKSAPVDPALPLQLSSIEVRILESYQEKMENLGFHFSVVDSTTISVLRVPTCLLLRENREVTGRGVSVLRQHLESLIREQVDSLLNTRGVGTDHPTIIRNVISSEACRGAVKFGHSLTVADCQAFLHNLSLCNLPFQCAHGRPALMPVVDLSMLKPKPQTQKLKLKKLQSQLF